VKGTGRTRTAVPSYPAAATYKHHRTQQCSAGAVPAPQVSGAAKQQRHVTQHVEMTGSVFQPVKPARSYVRVLKNNEDVDFILDIGCRRACGARDPAGKISGTGKKWAIKLPYPLSALGGGQK